MKTRTVITLLILCAVSAGCARFSTKQVDTSYEDGLPVRSQTTVASAYTLFQSKSELANWKAQQSDQEQGAEVGALNQETTESANEMLRTVIEAAVQAAIGAGAP